MKPLSLHSPSYRPVRLLTLIFALFLTNSLTIDRAFASETAGTPPSVQVSASLVSPIPGNGFKPGDQIQIQIQVSNLDNTDAPFRVDILDFPYQINAKVADYLQEYLRFGNNIILREATFSHGMFFRTNVYEGDQDKISDVEEQDLYFADNSNAYTWLLDDRFRNSAMGPNDVATLNLTVEFVVGDFPLFNKVANQHTLEYDLKIDHSGPGTGNGYNGSTFVTVPIDLEDYTPPSGSRTYTTIVKPEGLQAGESYMIEVGLINFGNFQYQFPLDSQNNLHSTQLDDFALTFDYGSFSLKLNNGFTPYHYNHFYDDVMGLIIPYHESNAGFNIRSLSVAYGDLEDLFQSEPKSVAETQGGEGNDFAISYLPETQEFWVRSVAYNCGYYSSEPDDCDVEQFSIYPLSMVRLFIQGVATLDQAGGEATINGTVDFEQGGPICGYQCSEKETNSTNDEHTSVEIDESIPIGVYTFLKTVSDPCFESGEKGYFKIEMSGADFRKTSSMWFVIDVAPMAVSPFAVFQNFIKSSPNNNGREYGAFSNEPGGGIFYAFNNVFYPLFFITNQPKTTETIETLLTNVDYNWYDQTWFKLPFDVENDATPGLHTNTATFSYLTHPFNALPNAKSAFGDVMVPPSAEYEAISASLLGEVATLFNEFLPSNPQTSTADFAVGCSVVSGFKFHDLDADGVRDSGEPGLEGWEITIQGSEGTYTALTDANGFYEFPHVKAGNYQVRETQQEGWVQSAPAGEGFHNISVSRAINRASADFGNYMPAMVYGYKYHDLSGSGTFDDGEPGKEGVRIELRDLSGNVVAYTMTDADGRYEFTGIKPGNYAIYEDLPQGWYQSQPGPGEGGFYYLVLSSGDEVGPKNFGNYELTFLEIITYFTDTPSKTTPDGLLETRTPASGVIVSGVRTGPAPLKPAPGSTEILLPGQGNFQGVTDEDGYLMVDGLLPGLYTISIQPPGEFISVVTPNPVGQVLVSGGLVMVEFGLYFDELAAPEPTTSSITGSVYRDLDGDGRRSFPSEPGVGGTTVTLTGTSSRGAEITRTATTDPNGTYVFEGLPAGRFVVNKHAEPGISVSAPLGGSYTVELGVGQHLGSAASGAPGGAGWLAQATAGDDATFAHMTLALDTDLDGVADTRIDASGVARFELGGLSGQTVRPMRLAGVQMYGDSPDGAVTLSTPGIEQLGGSLSGAGASADQDFSNGLVIEVGGSYAMSEGSLEFTGTADRWPMRHTRASFSGSVNLRNVQGTVVAQVIYAEVTPMHGVDFAAERADFGDAPASYGTLRAVPGDPFVITPGGIVYPNDGARHLLPWTGSPALTLGAGVTADADGQPGASADGDTDNGVVLPAAVAPNASFVSTMTVVGEGLLSVWVDANRNGVFESSERQISDEPVETGEFEVTLHSGAPTSSGSTLVRVRFTTQAGVGATGLSLDGEVEDYLLTVDASMAGGGGGLPTSDDGDSAIPTSFALHQNYPNPFNPSTVIPYDLASQSRVRITVYDVTGRPVATVLDASQNAGRHQVAFDAAGLPSGVYMVRLEAGGQVMVRKLTLLK